MIGDKVEIDVPKRHTSTTITGTVTGIGGPLVRVEGESGVYYRHQQSVSQKVAETAQRVG